MPAVVCPSCRSNLKAPAHLIGKKAPCPRCQASVSVPFAEKPNGIALAEMRPNRSVYPAAIADTAQAAALDATAEQKPLKDDAHTAAGKAPATIGKRSVVYLRAAVFVMLAVAGTFAMWMAVGSTAPDARPAKLVQPRR
jgi:hypothetical protein